MCTHTVFGIRAEVGMVKSKTYSVTTRRDNDSEVSRTEAPSLSRCLSPPHLVQHQHIPVTGTRREHTQTTTPTGASSLSTTPLSEI